VQGGGRAEKNRISFSPETTRKIPSGQISRGDTLSRHAACLRAVDGSRSGTTELYPVVRLACEPRLHTQRPGLRPGLGGPRDPNSESGPQAGPGGFCRRWARVPATTGRGVDRAHIRRRPRAHRFATMESAGRSRPQGKEGAAKWRRKTNCIPGGSRAVAATPSTPQLPFDPESRGRWIEGISGRVLIVFDTGIGRRRIAGNQLRCGAAACGEGICR